MKKSITVNNESFRKYLWIEAYKAALKRQLLAPEHSADRALKKYDETFQEEDE